MTHHPNDRIENKGRAVVSQMHPYANMTRFLLPLVLVCQLHSQSASFQWIRQIGGSSLCLFGQQTNIIHAGGAHVVHHVHHGAVFGASVGFDKDPLVHFIGQAVLHFGGELVGGNLIGAKEDLPVTHDGHQQGIFLVRVGHGRWAIHPGHVHAHALLQHGRDDQENDEQHQHHVHHGGDVDVGVDLL